MQNLSTQDSIKTKQLLPDRFWIIEQNGLRIGTIQRHDENNFIVTGTDSSIAHLTKEQIDELVTILRKGIELATDDIKKEGLWSSSTN